MEKHDLRHEFPEYVDKIHDLKISDNHFKRLFDEYDEINKEIQRIETGIEPTSDQILNELRLKRVHLKDDLFNMLKN
jgi:uncharacterized protein YdcH (DUF465 family)